MKRISIILVTLALACGGKKEEKTETTASTTPSTPSTTEPGSNAEPATPDPGPGSADAPEPAGELDLPTEVDFEDEASERITEKTIETELKSIEGELAE
jgi:hypothetical protein